MSLTHLPAPIPDLPPDGHIPAYGYPDPAPYEHRFVPTRPQPPMPAPQLPENFERYDLTPNQARKIIGIGPRTLDQWVDDRLIGYLRRPDGALRFRLSDCYRAAGVPLEADSALEPFVHDESCDMGADCSCRP